MNQPLIEEPTYFKLDQTADKFISEISKLSPNAKVLIIIEDGTNSIIKQATHMFLSDALGLIHISLIRLDQHERQSFTNRMNVARQLQENREVFLDEQTEKGNLN